MIETEIQVGHDPEHTDNLYPFSKQQLFPHLYSGHPVGGVDDTTN